MDCLDIPFYIKGLNVFSSTNLLFSILVPTFKKCLYIFLVYKIDFTVIQTIQSVAQMLE